MGGGLGVNPANLPKIGPVEPRASPSMHIHKGEAPRLGRSLTQI